MSYQPGSPLPLGVAGTWSLNFRDEFDGTSIDQNKWQILDPGLPWGALGTFANTGDFGNVTWRQQNVSVSGGQLTCTLDNSAGTQYGGGLVSKWTLGYGFYESRLKFTGGWPAFWIVDHGMGDATPQDPAVSGTEMDIAEGQPWNGGGNVIGHAVHWNGYGAGAQSDTLASGISDSQFHTFGFWWTPTSYRFYVDGALTWTFTTAISQTLTQYMVLNNAYWTGGDTTSTALFEYVRYWTSP